MKIIVIEDDVQDEFLSSLANIARYWAEMPGKTHLQRCDGVVFGVLTNLDGMTEDWAKVRKTKDGMQLSGVVAKSMALELHDEYCKYHSPRYVENHRNKLEYTLGKLSQFIGRVLGGRSN